MHHSWSLVLAVVNLLMIGSVVVNPLWFLSVAARFAMLGPGVTAATLLGNTVDFMKPVVRLALGDTTMNDLSRAERRSVSVKLWIIRGAAVFASFFGVFVPIHQGLS